MSTPDERLREARIAAGFKTMQEATEAHGLHYPTYAGHENGNRAFPHEAPRYAVLFKVALLWLMTGRGPMKPSGRNHPVGDLFDAIPADKQGQAIDYLTFLSRTDK